LENIIEEPQEETSRDRNIRLLGEVLAQVTAAYGKNLNAKFVAAPGFLGRGEGNIDCEVVTLQVFLPRTPAGCDMADQIIDQIIRQATGQVPPSRIVAATAVGRG
jgi:hypothetical protein